MGGLLAPVQLKWTSSFGEIGALIAAGLGVHPGAVQPRSRSTEADDERPIRLARATVRALQAWCIVPSVRGTLARSLGKRWYASAAGRPIMQARALWEGRHDSVARALRQF
jgi:hypothetical protein